MRQTPVFLYHADTSSSDDATQMVEQFEIDSASEGPRKGPSDPRRQKNEFNKLRKRLRRNVGNAIVDFNMIEDGDRVMVCV